MPALAVTATHATDPRSVGHVVEGSLCRPVHWVLPFGVVFNVQLWKTKVVEIAASQPTGPSLDTNAQQLFKCPMCLFADSAIELFIAHLENSHTVRSMADLPHSTLLFGGSGRGRAP